mmetsp:Transcript_31632/g.53955  ORF Transcript_31632/g.53955 Transcript_31632/m.53955 type:complete len:257 (-) Transcript_31632:226-996(-)
MIFLSLFSIFSSTLFIKNIIKHTYIHLFSIVSIILQHTIKSQLRTLRHNQRTQPLNDPQLSTPPLQRLQRHVLRHQILQHGLHERGVEPRQASVHGVLPVLVQKVLPRVRIQPASDEEVGRSPAHGRHERLVHDRPQFFGGVESEEEYPLGRHALRRPQQERGDQPRKVPVRQTFHEGVPIGRAVLHRVVIVLDPRHERWEPPALDLGREGDEPHEEDEVVGDDEDDLLFFLAVVADHFGGTVFPRSFEGRGHVGH